MSRYDEDNAAYDEEFDDEDDDYERPGRRGRRGLNSLDIRPWRCILCVKGGQ